VTAARVAVAGHRLRPARALAAAALGAGAALLVACGSSGGGLIPLADAGPLRADFEEVQRAAAAGNGSCTATEAALAKTELDFRNLPSSVDAGLRERLREGIANQRTLALSKCAQPLSQATSTGTTARTTTTPETTPTETTTTPSTSTETTPTTPPPVTTPTTPTTPGSGGGTVAPGEGQGNGEGGGRSGGVGAGGEAGK
jgi:hypothetical protein